MKQFLIFSLMISFLTSCGNVAENGEAIGQAKKVTKTTNIFCPNYYSFEMSLGIIQNGTGSISKEDIWMTVENTQIIDTLNKAVERGAAVKAQYNQRRFPFCSDSYILIAIKVLP